jgi:retinol dehydrogenase 12
MADERVTSEVCVEARELDLAKFESVRELVRKVDIELDRVDLVVENARIYSRKSKMITASDDWEMVFQVNVISTILLVILLVSILRRTSRLSPDPPRIVILASDTHYQAEFKEYWSLNILPALNDPSNFNLNDRYFVTKLLDIPSRPRILWTDSSWDCCARGYQHVYGESRNVLFNLLREVTANPTVRLIVNGIRKIIARTKEQSGGIIIHGAVSPDMGHLKGEYLSECEVAMPSKFVMRRKDSAKIVGWVNAGLLRVCASADRALKHAMIPR